MSQSPNQHAMVDPFGRGITYLRLSVTDRCNLRCVYCMAEEMTFLPKKDILSLEELHEVSVAFVELGVKKIRVTGGEPLVRRNIGSFLRGVGELQGLDELALTTNGVLIEKHLPDLLASGIKRLNVSLDSLDGETFAALTRFDKLEEVKQGLSAAKQAGLKVRLNAVVLKNMNSKDVQPLVDYALANEFDIAFIEEMPLGHIDSHSRADTVTANNIIREELSNQYELNEETDADIKVAGPARYWAVEGYKSKIGFISPHSNNFCSACNRVRVTVEGKLLLCLGHSDALDLREILRKPNYERGLLKEAIVSAMQLKPKQHYFDPEETQLVRFMSVTGG